MLFNGMATGLFLVTAIRELVAPEVFTSVAYLVGPNNYSGSDRDGAPYFLAV